MSVVSDSVVWVNPASVPTALTVAFRGTFSETARTGSNGSGTGPNGSERVAHRTHRTYFFPPEIATTRSLTLVLMPSYHVLITGTHRTTPHNHTPPANSFGSIERVPGGYISDCEPKVVYIPLFFGIYHFLISSAVGLISLNFAYR